MRTVAATIVAALLAAAGLTWWQTREPAAGACVGWQVSAGPDHGPVVVTPTAVPCLPASTEARP